ncbi:hypothetical protein Cgig2_030989 [Carnegiea gigantea]|uniref:Uncharacterized protein n=1 Tax=Carnegiea gigantea TaxID=171969 RepID=A0A9Q1KIJ2_9CARY|nr:hypothetical protein Cgig2_030989 [Carnegiea gigantea]
MHAIAAQMYDVTFIDPFSSPGKEILWLSKIFLGKPTFKEDMDYNPQDNYFSPLFFVVVWGEGVFHGMAKMWRIRKMTEEMNGTMKVKLQGTGRGELLRNDKKRKQIREVLVSLWELIQQAQDFESEPPLPLPPPPPSPSLGKNRSIVAKECRATMVSPSMATCSREAEEEGMVPVGDVQATVAAR